MNGLTTEIWYPARPGADTGERARYDIRAALPASEAAKIPDADNPWQSCDCARDLPLDEGHGPYPVVVFVHGTAAFRHQSLPIVTQWASQGFIVIAADHPGLYLADVLGMACGTQPPPQRISADVDALLAAIAAPSGDMAFLAGHVDPARVAVSGHSAGAAAAASATTKPGVRVVVSMAGVMPTTASGQLESTLYLGGIVDGIASWNRVSGAWIDSPKPKRLVGIANGGHLSFSDLCEAKNAAGRDLLQIANDHGVCGAQFAGFLFDCDPAHISGPKAWEIVAHSTTAVLRSTLQCRGPTALDLSALPDVAEFREEL